ncbi:unnamed protein product [Camellia sinensis]
MASSSLLLPPFFSFLFLFNNLEALYFHHLPPLWSVSSLRFNSGHGLAKSVAFFLTGSAVAVAVGSCLVCGFMFSVFCGFDFLCAMLCLLVCFLGVHQ